MGTKKKQFRNKQKKTKTKRGLNYCSPDNPHKNSVSCFDYKS